MAQVLNFNKNQKAPGVVQGNEIINIRQGSENLVWNDAATWTSTSNKNVVNSSTRNSTQYTGRTSANGAWTREEFINTSTTTVMAEATTTTVATRQAIDIESTLVPFMRAKRIKFFSDGLKPNSALIALFDKENITKLCTQTSYSAAKAPDKSILYANGAGQIEGYFDLPDGRFKSGTRVFRLEDAADAKISSAFANYTSSGTNTNITTINHQHTETAVQRVTTVTSNSTTGWTDPVAQSFYVDTVETNEGVYIHSVELYFDSVDAEHDIVVQVRNMSNGYPTIDLVYPYAWAKKRGSQINKSKNSSVGTTFIFPSPLFLPSNEEYCFVVMTNSEKTTLWCSEMGQKAFRNTDTTIPSGEIISKQPYLGSMFISQNNTTWDSQQTKDIKFKINRCKFKNKSGMAKLINSTKNDVTQVPNIRRLKSNSLEFTKGSKEVRIYAHGHGLVPGDTFILTFLDKTITNDIFGIPLSKLQGIPLTVKAIATTQDGISVTQLVFDVDFSGGALASGSGGGADIIMDGWNIGYSYAQLIKDDLQVDNTKISYFLSGRKQSQYINGLVSGYHQMTSNEIVDLNELYVIKNDEDGGATLDIVLEAQNNFISPMVNINNIGIHTHMNIVNNVDYLDSNNVKQIDSSPGKYIQKEVNLINPANELKVMFDTNMEFNTRVSVYYKVGNTQIDDTKEWVKLNPDEGKLLYSDAPGIYRTQKFTKSFGNDYWNVFKIMIVLQSDDRRYIPVVKNYRALALDAGPTT